MTEPTATITASDGSVITTPATPAAPVKPAVTSEPAPLTEEQQKAFDKVISSRAKEAAEKARRDLLKELGVTDADDPKALEGVKGKLTAAQLAEDANKSEAQKLQDKIAALEKERDLATQQAAIAQAKAQAERVNARLETLAKDARVQTPSDVVDYLEKHHASELKEVVDADGKIDEKKIIELIETVKKARAHWFSPGTPGSPSFRDALPGSPVDKSRGTKATLTAIKKGGW